MTLEFTELQEQVMDLWESHGIEYCEHDTQTGSSVPGEGFTETMIKPEYQLILDDPILCLAELGFTSISEYIASQKLADEPMQGIDMGYALLNKYTIKLFYQFGDRDLEFYIERNPQTGTAKLWLNPGNTDGVTAFAYALLAEAERAEGGKYNT